MEALPIEKDPRFKRLLHRYQQKVEMFKKAEAARFGAMLSLFTAPFFTVAAAMQMSVKAHENLYGQKGVPITTMKQLADKTRNLKQISANEKAIVESKSNANVKVYESPKMKEIKKRTGQVGINRPYTAPIYRSYGECIRGLYRQGVLGFYKGNMYRQAYFLLSSVTQVEIAFKLKEKTGSYGFMNHLIGAMVADIMFHPLHLIESRYILQNRITPTYKSLYTFVNQSYMQIYQGCLCHIPKTFCLALAGFQIFSTGSYASLILKELIFSGFAYPFVTVCRRIECQTNAQGMIPKRYKNARHCLGLTYREEGFKGLYRGFSSFLIGMTIYTAVVPLLAFIVTRKSPLLGLIEDDEEE